MIVTTVNEELEEVDTLSIGIPSEIDDLSTEGDPRNEHIDIVTLDNGNVLLVGSAATNYVDTQMPYLLEISPDLKIVNEFNLFERDVEYNVIGAQQLDDGTIAAFTVNHNTDAITLRLLDESLIEFDSVTQSGGDYSHDWFYTSKLFVNDDSMTVVAGNHAVTYDRELSITSDIYTYNTPIVRNVEFMDDGAFIGLDARSYTGTIYKVVNMPDDLNTVRESHITVPAVFATNPPPKSFYSMPSENKPYKDPWDMGGIEDEYLPEFYASGYDETTNRVNPIYAGAYITDLGAMDMDTGMPIDDTLPFIYHVAADGGLVSLTLMEYYDVMIPFMDEDGIVDTNNESLPLNLAFLPGHWDQLIYQFGTLPVDAPFYGDTTGEADLITPPDVDPCLSGTFIVYVGDMMMYQVQEDGTLKLLGDPYVMSAEEFGYDMYDDYLQYLYPTGELRDYPPFYSSSIS